MVSFARFRRSFNRPVWIIPRHSLWAWLLWLSSSCSSRYLISSRTHWSVIFCLFFGARNEFIFFCWAGSFWGKNIIIFVVFVVLIAAPCFAKWISLSEHINEKCIQGKFEYFFVKFVHLNELRSNSAVCTLGQFFSAHRCLVPLCCRYLHRFTCH